MDINTPYRTITREQFLFHEMRIVARLIKEGKSDEQIIQEVTDNNLFQYPTERMIKNITQVCLKRFNKANSQELINIVANDSADAAKQACLFLMMNYYRLVWEFMITVIGEKYRTKDTSFTKMDLNSFFTRLQEQNDVVASWSDATIGKCKQVLKKTLVENEYLDNSRSEVLNPVLLDFRVKEVIENSDNKEALIAFGCL
ncbi:DUF1819 family protein [Catenibacterium mitsuokai]|uniref:DUF1819 family protein n=1 Tax=Catenibacterium mitsuokai TaxID=100886 RepID=UPI003F9282D6